MNRYFRVICILLCSLLTSVSFTSCDAADLVNQITCLTCRGSGTCNLCKGKGFVDVPNPITGNRCSSCFGSGLCPGCDGTGTGAGKVNGNGM